MIYVNSFTYHFIPDYRWLKARALASAAGDNATFVEIPMGEHNDIPMSLLRTQLRELLASPKN